MTGSNRVLMHGLVVEAAFPIAALPTQNDIEVRCSSRLFGWSEGLPVGSLVARAQSALGVTSMQVFAEEHNMVVDFPGFLRAVLTTDLRQGETKVEFSAGQPEAAELVPVLLSPVVGALAMMHGALVLHATAVLIDGRAVLLLAERGGGKSSIAALLGSAGMPLLSEDVCAVRFEERYPVAASGVQEIRLRTTSPWLCDLPGLTGADTHPDGRNVVTPPRSSLPTAPVGSVAIVRLDRNAHRVTVDPIPGAHAVGAVLASQRCTAVGHALIGPNFAAAVDLVEQAPTSVVTVPWAPERRNRPLGEELALVVAESMRR